VHPPRPQDPKQTWEQAYAVKVRLKSTASTLLSEGAMAGEAAGGRRTDGPPSAGDASSQQAPAPVNPVEQGIGVLRGIFGK
jgi:hypothetical protein